MKKLIFTIFSFFLAINLQATDLTEGKQYIRLDTVRSLQPEIIEFFSFYCPHCRSFEEEYKIPQKIKEKLPEGTKFKQYHVNFLGLQSENLTRAWALAMALGVEEKVKPALFDVAQKAAMKGDTNSFSMENIRTIFLQQGITAEQFDGGINSFAVNSLVNKQIKAAEQMKVRGVPDFYINGKYRINPEGLSRTRDGFIRDYIETTIKLLDK